MRRNAFIVAAVLGTAVLTGPVLAQTAAPGSTENNLNNPGSVKSMRRRACRRHRASWRRARRLVLRLAQLLAPPRVTSRIRAA